jgi:NAD(P)H dehydrogenase (quinone)
MKSLVVVCHPLVDSLNHALAKAVQTTWTAAGCQVIYHDLHAESFDPILTGGEARGIPSDDHIIQAHIDELRNSDLLCVVHPNCWGAPPAMMKGWIDRVFAPEAAYAFTKGVDAGDAPIGLLKTRAALILNTGNTPLDREREYFGDPLDLMWRRCVLRYCGVSHVIRKLFGVVATSTSADRLAWLEEARNTAKECLNVFNGPGQRR